MKTLFITIGQINKHEEEDIFCHFITIDKGGIASSFDKKMSKKKQKLILELIHDAILPEFEEGN